MSSWIKETGSSIRHEKGWTKSQQEKWVLGRWRRKRGRIQGIFLGVHKIAKFMTSKVSLETLPQKEITVMFPQRDKMSWEQTKEDRKQGLLFCFQQIIN